MKKTLTTILATLILAVSAFAQYDKDVFSYRGRLALSDGKYAQAIENFNILAQLDTTDYWNYFYRGIAKYNLGDLRGAQKDFNTSLRLNPVFTNGYHYRAITKSRFGEFDDALQDLEKAIALRPGYSGIYFSRGVTYFLSQRFEQAVADFDKYIRKEPKDPSAYLNRGACHLFLSDTTKALNDYNKAIKLDRFDPEGYMRRGRLFAEQNKWDLAIKDMDQAISLDKKNTLAYFNRALMFYEMKDYNKAMADLNHVLKEEPGNALTLYNRSLIKAQVEDFEGALDDMDRVININPGNVLAYFNRASYFIELGRYQNALEDYSKAIELYPDFAKAYLNRSYVENLLGRKKDSKADYDTAQKKIKEYRDKNESSAGSFADTTKKYSSLLALDADFAKKDFDNELLQHRDIDIKLKGLYKFTISDHKQGTVYALSNAYEHPLLQRFQNVLPVAVEVTNKGNGTDAKIPGLYGYDNSQAKVLFTKGLLEVKEQQFTAALKYFDQAVAAAENDTDKDRYTAFYQAFYLMNRGVLRAEMIDFIASIESNVQTLTMDDKGAIRARVSDMTEKTYDYSEAIADMQKAASIVKDLPYLWFNLGNLYCLSSQLVNSIDSYDKAISLYPAMGDAYYNRGLVLIYLKDKEKGCIDLSRAGELGVAEAYGVITKYCKEEKE